MTRKTPRMSSRLFALCFLAYAVVYIGRKNFSACMPGMIADGVIDKLLGGAVGTAFLAVYACGQLVNGLLGDRFSPKLMIAGGLMGAAAMNLLMSVNSLAPLFPVIWGANGFFCSMLWSPIVRCLSEWVPDEERASDGAKISVTIPLGSILSYLICAVVLHFGGWREVFVVCGVILAAASLIFFSGMISLAPYIKSAEKKTRTLPADDAKDGRGGGIIALIVSSGLLFAVGGILFNGMLKDGLDLWVPSYINEFFGMPQSVSSALAAILPVVNLSGVFVARFINERFTRNEMTTCAVLFVFSVLSFIPLCLLTAFADVTASPAFYAVLAALLISATSSVMLGINSMLLTFIPFRFARAGRSSSVTGFLNSCSYAAASLSGVIYGMISSEAGWSATVVAFGITAAAGAALCAAGIGSWKRGRERLDSY